jgi:hypothetical protein
MHSLALAPFLAASLAAPALAQETQSPTAPATAAREGVIAYTPADFADARPNTALDMISRLPGFTFEGGDQVRGFAGAAGNVLIDGQRPTIKTDSLQDTLARIPIGQVERIDLIRGGAPGIDMQGRSVVANVIRKRVDTFQQVLQLQGYAFAETGRTLPGWSWQATRRAGDHQFDVSIGRGISMDDSVGAAWRTTLDVPTGSVLFQDAYDEGDGFSHSLRANYKGPILGGTFSANGLINTDEFKDESTFDAPTRYERYISRSANDRGEIGLNYVRPLAETFEAEGLILSKYAQGAADATGLFSAPSSATQTSSFRVDATAGESIGRGILRWRPSQTLQFEGGGEVAFNFREQQVGLVANGAAVALPASDVRVEELRSEGFLQGTWRVTPQLSLEAGIRVERSTITQSGDTSLERSFTYPKPRLLVTWSPWTDTQIRFRAEREVGQLNFQDFASNVNLSSNVLTAGNAQLQPDQTWNYEAAFEQRFWGGGAVVLTLRHEEIEDVVDRFPFLVPVDQNGDGVADDANNDGVPDTVLVSGPGNIGDGTNDVVQLNVTLPLDKLGDTGGELRINALWQDSEVVDPLTGETRRISGQRPDNITFNYRQDLPAQNLTFGATWFAGWFERRYFLEEVDTLRLRNFFEVFGEWKPNPGFTLRTELKNIAPYDFSIRRDVFDGPRSTGDLQTIELERRKSQVIGRIIARWTFG